MRQALLVSVAAAALAAGSTLALAQGGNPGGAAPQGGATINANPGGASGGAAGSMTREAPGTIHESPAPGGPKGAQERTAPQQNQKATQDRQQPGTQQRRETQAPAQQGGTRQGQSEQPAGSKQGQAEQPSGSKQGQAAQPSAGGAKQGERPMASRSVSLTTEQKTTIRNTVINTGPKVTNVNFDIKVGVVVPRTVRVAPLPATIIEIEPSWRGYMYFVYADEIIVVEPGTLRIVAVLEV